MRKFFVLVAAVFAMSVCLQAQDKLKGKILKLDFASGVAERGGSGMALTLKGLSSNSTVSLLSIERALEAAAADDKIAMVYIKPENFSGGISAAEEIRRSLEKFKESGKPVVAYSVDFSGTSYYLASVADKIVMNPAGEGQMVGLSSQIIYYKDLLDTLGVKVQLIRHGKFKSAGEPYIRNDISEANREQYETMLGTIWRSTMSEAAASRGLTLEDMDRFANSLVLDTAPTWKENGLVDTLMHKGEMEAYLSGLFGVDKVDYLQVVDIEKYISKMKKGPSKNKIAVVFANGSIGDGDDVDGVKMAQTIADVRADSTVKAIVWRINSPGGAVVSSDLIRREIDETRKVKPVIATYGSLAASGGYWISSSSDIIFTDNTTLTGSIGVFGMVPALENAIEKVLKVNPVTVGTHAHSDMMQGMREFTDEEREWMQKNIDNIYEKFVGLVAESRGLETAMVDSIAQGRVWAGADALNLGLADRRGTALDAVKYAAEKVGLEKYRIVYYPEAKSGSLLSALRGKKDDDAPLVDFSELSGSDALSFGSSSRVSALGLPTTLQAPVSALAEARRLAGDLSRPTIQARLPFIIQ